ncbi:MAG: hypothetical protein EXQ52_03375 [Bryobacterales bacterium]|nr:hypothetical protein [Bryobacterales bacterium]
MKTKTLALLLGLCAYTPASKARNVFVLPGSSNTASSIFTGEPFAASGTVSVSPSTFQILAHPAGTKYYAISRSAVDTVLVIDASLTSILRRIPIPTGVTVAALTPDGRRLVLVGTSLSIIDTTADLLLSIPPVDVGTTPIDVAISHDSNRAFVLSSASNRVTTIDLFGNTQLGNAISIPGISTGITRAPNDLLYVTAQNRIFEIDGRKQSIRNEIPLNEIPGKLAFTPDGARGIAVNSTTVTGSVVVVFETATRTVTKLTTAQLPGVTLEKIVVAGNNRALGISAGSRILYDIGLNPTNGSIATLGVIGGFVSVADVAVSDEQPVTGQGTARYAYIVTAGALTRVSLTTNSPSGQLALSAAAGGLAFAGPASTASPAAFSVFNANQTFTALQGPQALALRVVDASSLPVINVPVTFSSSSPGLIIQGQSTTTNGEGIASTTVVLPATTGSGTVTATIAGNLFATFALSITGGAAAGVPTTIESAGGNGQVTLQNSKTNLPISILLRDGNGTPVPNSPVTWSLQGTGTIVDALAQTDVNGIATASFIGGSLTGGVSSTQQTIIVGNATLSKTLYVTTSSTLPAVSFLAPAGENPRIVAQAGQTIAGGVQIRLNQFFGNVGVRATANVALAATDPSASCTTEAGLVLTDFAGTASCDLKIGPRTGETNLTVNVGGYTETTIPLVVNPGPPGALRVIQGNNQAGLAGQQLPLALVAEVADAFGNALPGAAVEWEVVTPGTITLSNIFSRGDGRGRVSALATLGNTGGTYQVRVKIGTTATATFNLTVSIPFAQLLKVPGGEPQSAAFNQQFASPLTAQVNDSSGRPIQGIPIAFTVASGSGSVVTSSAISDSLGRASTLVRAGTAAGPLTIVAVAGSFSVTFNLAVLPPGPSLTASSFVSAASAAQGVTPGGLIEITGRGLAPDLQGTARANPLLGPAPTTLAGLSVSFNGTPAPILSVTNTQGTESAIVQAPFELQAGVASVRVDSGGTPLTVDNVPVVPYQPGILETVSGGRRYGVVLKGNGSYASPSNPVSKGETIRVYATGLGQVAPVAATGRAGVPGQRVSVSMIVGVDNVGARIVNAQLAVNLIGVYEVDVEVPQEATAGTKTLVIAIVLPDGSVAFSQNTLIAIQ